MSDIDTEFSEIQSYLVANWQKVLSAVFTLCLGAWFYGEYKETMNTRLGEASYGFSQASESLSEALRELKKDPSLAASIEKKDTALSNLERVKSEYQDSFYAITASIKKIASLLEMSGNINETPKSDLFKGDGIEKKLLAEVSELLSIRSELEKSNNNVDAQAKVIEKLKSLLNSSKYVKEEAVLTLSSILSSKELKSLLEELSKNNPELQDNFNNLLSDQGIHITQQIAQDNSKK